jgi:hypothetical protein
MSTTPRLPWDLWLAIIAAVLMALSAIFEPAQVALVAIFLAGCTYILIKAFR